MGLRRFGGPGMHGIGGVPLSSLGGAFHGGYFAKVLATGPIAYWPLWEASGTTARCLVNPAQNGTYNSNVSTWPPGTGIGDGNTAPGFDGANDYVNIYSATLAAAFNGQLGSLMIWVKVANAGTWTDGADRMTSQIRVDATNQVYIAKHNTNDRMRWVYAAGGVTRLRDKTPITSIAFDHYAWTWTHAGNQMIAYYNGVQEGATWASPGAWAGALDPLRTLIGSTDMTPLWPWHGWLAHCAVWNRVLAPAEVVRLATL